MGDLGSISESGRSPGERNGYPHQFSCLENSLDRGYSPLGHKESDTTEQLTLSESSQVAPSHLYLLYLLCLQGDVSYEERACEGGKFATVEVTDKPVDEALREAMPKVMKYVGGSNDKGECP